jgi:hypothetical protein
MYDNLMAVYGNHEEVMKLIDEQKVVLGLQKN